MTEEEKVLEETAGKEYSEPTPEEIEARADVLYRIEKTIAKIRPYIQADGGDVQLIDFQDGVVYVSMLGACAGCMIIDSTLTDGIEALLVDEVPEVKAVRLAEIPAQNYYYY